MWRGNPKGAGVSIPPRTTMSRAGSAGWSSSFQINSYSFSSSSRHSSSYQLTQSAVHHGDSTVFHLKSMSFELQLELRPQIETKIVIVLTILFAILSSECSKVWILRTSQQRQNSADPNLNYALSQSSLSSKGVEGRIFKELFSLSLTATLPPSLPLRLL